ncbi:MAG: M1 family aminopeptidase [Bacteroidia bacterium]
MFGHMLRFELRYRLRRPATWVYLGVMVLIGLLYGSLLGGALGPEAQIALSQGQRLQADAPYLLHQLILSLAQVPGTFIIAAFMAVPVLRDFQYEAHELFFTRPIGKTAYLGARYLGSLILTLGVMLGLAGGMVLARWMPGVDPALLGTFRPEAYLYPYLTHVIPYVLLTGTLFFALVSLTRNSLLIYLNALILLVLFSVASSLANQIEHKMVASLLDPSGGVAFLRTTEYWTAAQRNTQLVPVSDYIGYNLLIWMSVTAGIAVFTLWRFRLVYALEGRPSKTPAPARRRKADPFGTFQKLALPRVSQRYTTGQHMRLLGRLTRYEIGEVLRSPIFIVMAVVAVLFMVLTMVFSGRAFGTPTLPVTYQVIGSILGGMVLFVVAIIIFYSGEMVWKERQHRMEEIYDALPIPNWVSLGSRLLALCAIPYLLMTLGIVTGIISQAVQGYFRFELGQYFVSLYGLYMIDFVLLAVLAFLVQTLSPNKFLGFFLVVLLYFFFQVGPGLLRIEDNLFIYMSNSRLSYSDMNGFGHFLGPYLLYKLYWSGLALAMLVLTNALWSRGTEAPLRTRLRLLRARMPPAAWGWGLAGLAIFVATGGYIFYNTHILNDFSTSRDQQRAQVTYEQRYKRYDGIAQPRIAGIYLEVDLYPQARDFDARGTYLLRNKTAQPIDSIHLFLNDDLHWDSIGFDRGGQLVLDDLDHGYRIYQLPEALLPGDSLRMHFVARFDSEGFTNNNGGTQVLYNGTFINHGFFPSIGYERNLEITEPDLRKKYDLPERPRFPLIDDTVAVRNTLFAHDADWIDFEAVVSTVPDQIAMTPGYLQRTWEADGRRYFHYKMDAKMAKFYNIVSARYEVRREVWQAPDGREIQLEIYHHPEHTYNLDRMMEGMKQSLAYYSEAFGPYQHRQLRILEFPRYMTFAQSFANTVPFSESAGFITDVDEDDVDFPFYITAHEAAHQWWAHQVAGGAVQGFQFLSETMSQYAALMVMERTYGRDGIKKYLRYEMDNYLSGRSGERREELPALLSENQLYIHYNKGSVIMYALKDYLGQDSLDAALRRYVSAVRFQDPPYTTTREWLRYVQAVVPDSLRGVLTDMFETITLFDNRTEAASFTQAGADSSYAVELIVHAAKVRDDGKGNETEVPIDDYIDIGIFGREKIDGKWEEPPLYFRKHHLTRPTDTLRIVVDRKPAKAGIDPYFKLIDRSPGDNVVSVKSSTP